LVHAIIQPFKSDLLALWWYLKRDTGDTYFCGGLVAVGIVVNTLCSINEVTLCQALLVLGLGGTVSRLINHFQHATGTQVNSAWPSLCECVGWVSAKAGTYRGPPHDAV